MWMKVAWLRGLCSSNHHAMSQLIAQAFPLVTFLSFIEQSLEPFSQVSAPLSRPAESLGSKCPHIAHIGVPPGEGRCGWSLRWPRAWTSRRDCLLCAGGAVASASAPVGGLRRPCSCLVLCAHLTGHQWRPKLLRPGVPRAASQGSSDEAQL